MDSEKEYSNIQKIVKQQLKPLGKKSEKTRQDIEKLQNSRAAIRKRYISLMLADAEFASAHEVPEKLWKNCFYTRIEECRVSIRKIKQAEGPQNKRLLRKITGSFLNFLDRSISFYESFVTKLDAKISQVNINKAIDDHEEVKEKLLTEFVHRSYICLGDLARYRETCTQDLIPNKSFVQAANWYGKALSLIPDNGYPHNQLAVIAMYTKKDCLAIYHYIRSVYCNVPWETGKQNLKLQYQKINKGISLDELSHVVVSSGNHIGSAQKRRLFKNFLKRFPFVHSMLMVENPFRKDKFMEQITQLEVELTMLVKISCISRDIQIAIIITNVYSVMEGQNDRRLAALKLSFACCQSFLSQIAEDHLAGLLPVSIFVDWASRNTNLLLQCYNEDFFESFLQEISKQWELIVFYAKQAPLSMNFARKALDEEVQLAGFSPVSDLYRKFISARKNEIANEQTAHAIRAAKVMMFACSLFGILPEESIPFPRSDTLNMFPMNPKGVALNKGDMKNEKDIHDEKLLKDGLGISYAIDAKTESESKSSFSPRSAMHDVDDEISLVELNDKHRKTGESEIEEDEIIVFKPNFGQMEKSSTAAFAVAPPVANLNSSLMSQSSADESMSSPIEQIFNSTNMLTFTPSSSPSKQTFSPFAFNAFTNENQEHEDMQEQWNSVQLAFAQLPTSHTGATQQKESGTLEAPSPIPPPPGFP